jgi:hypothetical protein
MVRVLRPGGTIVVSDLARMSEYAKTFEQLGRTVDHGGTAWGTLPFQRVVVAKNRWPEPTG